MENLHPDKLFREKLARHEVSPGVETWARLEAALDKKDKRAGIIWWQMAAAVVVLALATGLYLAWNTQENSVSPELQIAATTPPSSTEKMEDEELVVVEEVVPEQIQKPVEREKPMLALDNKPREKAQSSSTQKEKTAPLAEPKVSETLVAMESEAPKLNLESIESLPAMAKDVQVADAIALAEPAFTVEIFKGLPEEESGTEKGKGLKQILNVALDFKNGEIGLGDLREKKDELLAGELSERRRNQRNRN